MDTNPLPLASQLTAAESRLSELQKAADSVEEKLEPAQADSPARALAAANAEVEKLKAARARTEDYLARGSSGAKRKVNGETASKDVEALKRRAGRSGQFATEDALGSTTDRSPLTPALSRRKREGHSLLRELA